MSPLFAEAEPTAIYLTPSPAAWQAALPRCSQAGRQWMAHLNQLCLQALLPWLQQDYPQAIAWTTAANRVSYWEFVDGCAVQLPSVGLRLVIMPSTALDRSELRVPQEWVELPSWAGHGYLAAQADPDDGWIRLWGFTTHARLKQPQFYDPIDRSYALPAEQLITDLDVLWEAIELCPQELAQAALTPLPPLSPAQAEHLIARLSRPEVKLPQSELPFAQWGALLNHGGWRQQLYHRRVGLPEPWSVRQWLSSQLSPLAQQIGWERNTVSAVAGARGVDEPGSSLRLSRSLQIAGQPYQLHILPQGPAEAGVWRVELRRSPDATPAPALIPPGTKLRLLTEDLQPFANNEATATTATERLYIVVSLAPDEGLVWEVEPTPDYYEREILRF
jgi:hypothetical protein